MSDEIYSAPQQNPEQLHQQQHPQHPYQGQPLRSAAPKVFGILHIIYAAIGIVGALIGLGAGALMNSARDQAGVDKEQLDSLLAGMDDYLRYSYIDAGVKVVFGVILLIAGIKLLKYQKSGLKLTNLWGVTRILWMIAYTALSYPALKQFQESLTALNPEAMKIQSSMNTVSMIIGIAVISIYPIVSMILLNRASVKKDLH